MPPADPKTLAPRQRCAASSRSPRRRASSSQSSCVCPRPAYDGANASMDPLRRRLRKDFPNWSVVARMGLTTPCCDGPRSAARYAAPPTPALSDLPRQVKRGRGAEPSCRPAPRPRGSHDSVRRYYPLLMARTSRTRNFGSSSQHARYSLRTHPRDCLGLPFGLQLANLPCSIATSCVSSIIRPLTGW
jgi:hypothetical protein